MARSSRGGDAPGGAESSGSAAVRTEEGPAATGPLPHRHPQAVGFLLSQLGFETSRRFGQLMSEVELDPRQFALMRAIEAYEGQSQNALGTMMRIPPSSMVAVIDHLEARGMVERRPHPSDRRSRVLHITEHGRDVLRRAAEVAMGLEQTLCEGLTADERTELLSALARVADNLGLVQGLHPAMSEDHGHRPWAEERS